MSIVGADGNGNPIASASLPLTQLLEQTSVALDGTATNTSDQACIAIHGTEYQVVPGTLQLKLQGHDLPNKERGLGFIRKSDPFYVIVSRR